MGTASSFVYAIIGTEVLSLIIFLILLMGSMMEGRGKSKRTRLFIMIVFSVMVGCVSDLISWLLEGQSEWTAVLYFTTLFSMVMTIVAVGVYIAYLYAYIGERKKISDVPRRVGWIGTGVCVLATVIAGASGKLFSFPDGFFCEEPLYSAYVAVNIGYLAVGMIVITKYREVLDMYDKLAGYAYILMPVISVLIGIWIDGWDFSYPSCTISLLLLYIMIQSDRTKKLEKEGTEASYQAAHDELTGLYNRAAYQSRIRQMEMKDEDCGIIFSDVNGLKYVNDTYGHEEGDRLLVHYAKILAEIFRMNEIYRISGDEFICIIENASQDAFRKQVDEFNEILNRESPPLACIGAAYGSSRDMESIIREAEVEMYAGKKVIHELFPKTRRVRS